MAVPRPLLSAALVAWLAVGSASCIFDTSGVGLPLRGDARPDAPRSEEARVDDRRPSWEASPDVTWPPDQGFLKPVGKVDLLTAWNALEVDCVDNEGRSNGTTISILDDDGWVELYDGAVTLGGAPQDTRAWVNGKPVVTVIFDPNSCGDEDPRGGSDWSSAGILIRGATLDGGKLLVLASGTTTADMDFFNATAGGDFQDSSDFASADDSKLSATPQLVPTVTALKLGILQAAMK